MDKFFSVFNDWLDDSLMSSFKKNSSNFDMSGLKDELEAVSEVLRQSEESVAEYKKKIKDLKNELNDGSTTLERRREIEAELTDTEDELNDAMAAREETEKILGETIDDVTERELNAVNRRKASYRSLEDQHRQLEDSIKELNEGFARGKVSVDEYKKEQEKLHKEIQSIKGQKALVNGMKGFNNALKKSGKEAADGVKDFIGGAIGKIPGIGPALEAAFEIGWAVVEEQFERNKRMVELSRKTGGVVNQEALGTDSTGRIKGSMVSLDTVAAQNRLEIEELQGSLEGLASDGFGQTIGMVTNLKQSSEAMRNYAVENAKFTKEFGADFNESTQNILQDFGGNFQDMNTLMYEGAMTAQSLGLNVGQYSKNLASATRLSKDFTISSLKGMEKLAVAATQLGVKAEDLLGLTKGLNTATDVFEQQAKLSSMGMNELASQQAQIFAMKQQGKDEEAANVALQAIIKDLQAQGGMAIKDGNLTRQAKDMLKLAGFDEDAQLQMVQRAIKNPKAVETMGQTVTMTPENQAKFDEARNAQYGAGEKMGYAWDEFKSTFFDVASSGGMVAPAMDYVTGDIPQQQVVQSQLIPSQTTTNVQSPTQVLPQTMLTQPSTEPIEVKMVDYKTKPIETPPVPEVSSIVKTSQEQQEKVKFDSDQKLGEKIINAMQEIPGTKANTQVTVNTNVEGAFGDKQSYKNVK